MRSTLKLLLLLASVCLSGCDRRPSPKPGNLSAMPWITPLPWDVLQRVSSPDGLIDAVLVTRPDSQPPVNLGVDPTDLYLVPHKMEVPREAPYPLDSRSHAHRKRVRAETPFHAYEVEGIAAEWKDNQTLRIRARRAVVHDCDPIKEVFIEGEKRLINIEYSFTHATDSAGVDL
jgi:hypothetical protein